MQTHMDDDFRANQFMEELRAKADRMVRDKQSEITAGKEGEEPLAEWKHGDMHVRHMPDDELGVLRISVGGCSGEAPVKFNYLVFRGATGECIDLLKKALFAITKYQ